MDGEDLERVRGIVAAIPAGSVLAYGAVAARAGLPGRARLVGRILAEDGHDLPWHRVLRADGTPRPTLPPSSGPGCAPRACWPTAGGSRCAATVRAKLVDQPQVRGDEGGGQQQLEQEVVVERVSDRFAHFIAG